MKPFLKWAGSKMRLINVILNAMTPATRLIEPFTGSGAVFINSNYSSYLLAENNGDLVNLFQYLQSEGPEFIQYCSSFFSTENNCASQYYHFREQFNQSLDLRYKAALFLFLNRHGYNGLCRYNQSKLFNVPFGRYSKPYFPQLEMNYFYQKSQQAHFIKSDFRQTFKFAQSGDLIYCDPPYVPLSTSAYFSSYTDKKFNEQDQIDLAHMAEESVERGIRVIISNHDTPKTRSYYHKATRIVSFPVKRLISCKASQRQVVQELIAIF